MRKNFGQETLAFPMPVLIIATYDENGTPDAMNAAWGGISEYNQIAMCLTESHKTVQNAKKTGAFTVSFGTEETVVESDYVGIVSGNTVPDKIARAGLHTVKSEFVNAPVIEEMKVALECELIEYNPETCIMRGRIVNVSADESVLDEEGKIDCDKLHPLIFDTVAKVYRSTGSIVAKAFSAGKALK